MGLDSYFKIKKYITPKFSKDINLCGGLFSGHGSDGSFRGKVYAELIKTITDVDIYQEEISHEVVEEMSNKLSKTSYNDINFGSLSYLIKKEEYESLVKLFKEAAAKKDCVLLGWW